MATFEENVEATKEVIAVRAKNGTITTEEFSLIFIGLDLGSTLYRVLTALEKYLEKKA
jgi:hypothetical protein